MFRTIATGLSITLITGAALGQTFSLDDNPTAPIRPPQIVGLFSAEDPFGLNLPASVAGLLGYSPSLLTATGASYFDGDLLTSDLLGQVPGPYGPITDVVRPNGTFLNAVSADHEEYTQDRIEFVGLRFSVDRATSGQSGTALSTQYQLNQHPGDIFVINQQFPHPGQFRGLPRNQAFVGLLPPAVPNNPGGNSLQTDESWLCLTAGRGRGVLIVADEPAPSIFPSSHDNVDAFNALPRYSLDVDGDTITDIDYFFSVPPAEAFQIGVSAADVFAVAQGTGSTPSFPWAAASQLGLDRIGVPSNPFLQLLDDVDALVVWDEGEFSPFGSLQAEPILDFAIFSLSEGSASLTAIRAVTGFPVDGSTVFFTDFNGSFAVYLFGTQLGVANTAAQGIFQNIDALEIDTCDPCFLADTNKDGDVNPADFNAWIIAFNSNDPVADQNCDGRVEPADFNAWILNYNAGCP